MKSNHRWMAGMRLASLFILCSVCSFAQDSESAFTQEISLNATSFVRQFALNNNAEESTASPYLIQYKLLGAKSNGLRTGFGANYNEVQDFRGDLPEQSRDWGLDFRIGYERCSSLSNRWDIFYGIDAVANYRIVGLKTTSNLGFGELETETKTVVTGFGAGPVLGIRFKISDRISLFTESTAYFTRSENKETVTFSSEDPTLLAVFGLENSDDTFRELRLNMLIPTNVFFAFRF